MKRKRLRDKRSFCGPYYMPKFIRCWLSKKNNAACRRHDIDYEKGELSKNEADKRFYENMLKYATTPLDRLIARVYYWMVCKFGDISYKRKN